MKIERAREELSSSVNYLSIPELEKLVVPASQVVTQRYDHTNTPYGLRSTCEVASVINIVRLRGYQVPDFQNEIIRDARLPWDPDTGGIQAGYDRELAGIYNEYMPGIYVEPFGSMPLRRVLKELSDGSAVTVSTGHAHSVALYTLFRKRDNYHPFSMIADPINGGIKEIQWLALLTRGLIQIDDLPGTPVGTRFLVR